jgi:4'-phosphopantetheinyl transferase
MALYSIQPIGKHGKIALWHSTEKVDELLRLKAFSQEEVKQTSSFLNEKRKKEWLVSTLLASTLTNEENSAIHYNEFNKPFLALPGKHISISHSHELQCMVLDHHTTGIDIEKISDKIMVVKNKFMSNHELSLLGTTSLAEKLTLCWCVKEAVYKCYGKKELTLKENIFLHDFTYASSGIITATLQTNHLNQPYSLRYETVLLGNHTYLMACILHED